MKKHITLITAVLMAASAVSGCGGKSDKSSEPETTTAAATELPTVAMTLATEASTAKELTVIDPFDLIDFNFRHDDKGGVVEDSSSFVFQDTKSISVNGQQKMVKCLEKPDAIGIRRCKNLGADMMIYRDALPSELKEGDKVAYHLGFLNDNVDEKDVSDYIRENYGIQLTRTKKEITVHFSDPVDEVDPFENSPSGQLVVSFSKKDNHIEYNINQEYTKFNTTLKKYGIELSLEPTLVEGRDVNDLLAGDKVKFGIVLKKDGIEYKGVYVLNKLLADNGVPLRFTQSEKVFDVLVGNAEQLYSKNVNADFKRSDEWREIVSDKDKYDKYDIRRIDGSTATIPITAELLRQFCGIDDHVISQYIYHNTTGPAYENLILGKYDKNIIIVTEPSEDELALAAEHNVELEVTPVALDGFVFITHKDNPVDSLTVEQIQGIYSGAITNWSEVGGNDEPIIAYQREANSGSQTVMQNMVMKDVPLMDPPKTQIQEAMGSLIEYVAKYDNSSSSIGYTFYYYINNLYKNQNIKVIKIDGVSPDNENLLNKSYPFSSGYFAVTIKGADADAEELKDYLISDEGQELVKLAGYCPVR